MFEFEDLVIKECITSFDKSTLLGIINERFNSYIEFAERMGKRLAVYYSKGVYFLAMI